MRLAMLLLFVTTAPVLAAERAAPPLAAAARPRCAASLGKEVSALAPGHERSDSTRCPPTFTAIPGALRIWHFTYWTLDADSCTPFVLAQLRSKEQATASPGPWQRTDGPPDTPRMLVAAARSPSAMPMGWGAAWVGVRSGMRMDLYAPTLATAERRRIQRLLERCADEFGR